MVPERILLVDDVAANLAVLTGVLEPAGYEVLVAPSGATGLRLAVKAQPDLILLDVMMPELGGIETCRQLKQNEVTRDIPVLFITARSETASMVEGFGAGGVDYIVKPFQAEEVLSRVATHLRLSRLNRELAEKNRSLELRTAELSAEMTRRRGAEHALHDAGAQLDVLAELEASRGSLDGLIGISEPLRRMVDDIRRVSAFASTSVLITGESGTGKELIARAVHFGSSRARAPFVPLNCVAIPAELAESMLFGHVKGAFTGAAADRKGLFEMAHGGTLFLDEIGDMPLFLQAKLLRVLEDGRLTPVGASEPRAVNVRIIAATNAELEHRIREGTFRQDLYFRLAHYVIASSPLRERPEDVPILAQHFLKTLAPELGIRAPRLSDSALAMLQSYPFPGNVRELKNIIERALIQSGGESIQPEHLRLPQRSPGERVRPPSLEATATATAPATSAVAGLPLNLAEAEDLLIARALQQTQGNIADAARLLGVHRTRIYRKLAKDGGVIPDEA
ncbi:MAG: sigma-54-dependent Fis family transcriptional regulator [Verrucomicrobiales bacterium]|nr:sigma-54-dependent Fis family transcriptional regulator [Verrucomicrobiales bacterium]